MTPKYALPEFERKFLVPVLPGNLGEPTIIEDLYIHGTWTRLRKMTSPDGRVVHKLGKKYGAVRPGEEPIVNIYLQAAEYNVYAQLQGSRLEKKRYRKDGFSIDVFKSGAALAEAEATSWEELQGIALPDWLGDEVTGNQRYEGVVFALEYS